jgi:hypothetical protein
MASACVGPLRPIATIANEQIARLIVRRIKEFRTAVPYGQTWEAFAVAEILVHLNVAGRRECTRCASRRS